LPGLEGVERDHHDGRETRKLNGARARPTGRAHIRLSGKRAHRFRRPAIFAAINQH
jgi:hypothetical protein